MKFTASTIAAVAALIGSANAQSDCLSAVTQIPACALGYIAEIGYSSFSCDIIDFGCQCSNLIPIATNLQNSLSTYGSACDFGDVAGPAYNFCNSCSAYTGATLNAIESSCQPSAVAIPPCALGYLASAGVAEGCDINNFECQCSKFGAIEGDITNEVVSFCQLDGVSIAPVLASATALCDCVSPSSSGGPAPISTPTGGTGPVTTPTTPGVSVPTTPGVSVPTTPGSSPSGSKNGTTPSVSAPPTSGNSPTGIMSISHFTGAGATASAVGGLFAMVAGVVALL